MLSNHLLCAHCCNEREEEYKIEAYLALNNLGHETASSKVNERLQGLEEFRGERKHNVIIIANIEHYRVCRSYAHFVKCGP